MDDPEKQKQISINRQKNISTLIWGTLIISLLIFIAAPTLIIFFFGMVPTFVAVITDRRKEKSAAICVGSMNFIGVFPYVMDLWIHSNTVQLAISTISNLFSILVMYAAAGFGWLIFMSLPAIISSVIILNQQRKMARLRGEQKELIEEWGPEVAALVEMNRMTEQKQAIDGNTLEPS